MFNASTEILLGFLFGIRLDNIFEKWHIAAVHVPNQKARSEWVKLKFSGCGLIPTSKKRHLKLQKQWDSQSVMSSECSWFVLLRRKKFPFDYEVPNAVTLAAIEEAESGKLKSNDSVGDFFKKMKLWCSASHLRISSEEVWGAAEQVANLSAPAPAGAS